METNTQKQSAEVQPDAPLARRWAKGIGAARAAYADLEAALDTLEGMRQEYAEWLDDLPENRQDSALGEKLNAIVELDFDRLADIDSELSLAEGIDLPRRRGKD